MVELKLRFTVELDTTRSESQIRQALISSGLQAKAENKITALVAGDAPTTLDPVDPFDFRLDINDYGGNRVDVNVSLIIKVDTTRTVEQMRNALNPYFNDLKQELRALAAPAHTTITGWHVQRQSGEQDESEP